MIWTCPARSRYQLTTTHKLQTTPFLSSRAIPKSSRMADLELTEFATLIFHDPTAARATPWTEVTSELKAVPGVNAVYFGYKIESPETWVLVIQWTGEDAFKSYVASEAFKPWYAKYKALVHTESIHQVPLGSGARAALGAPCTEVFTAFGTGAGFSENMGNFVKGMDAASPAGYHGTGWGEVVQDIETPGGKKAPAALMALGWDSMDVHLKVKSAPGNRECTISRFVGQVQTGLT